MNFTILFAAWSALALLVLFIAVYRKVVARQEDNMLHLQGNEGNVVDHQLQVAHKLEVIDRVGQVSTIAVAVLGLVVAAAYFYNGWVNTSQFTH